jgi:hypothetical protein
MNLVPTLRVGTGGRTLRVPVMQTTRSVGGRAFLRRA